MWNVKNDIKSVHYFLSWLSWQGCVQPKRCIILCNVTLIFVLCFAFHMTLCILFVLVCRVNDRLEISSKIRGWVFCKVTPMFRCFNWHRNLYSTVTVMFVLSCRVGAKTQPESKCPELLANYCDMLLRKTPLSKKLTSEEVEKKLKDVVSFKARTMIYANILNI